MLRKTLRKTLCKTWGRTEHWWADLERGLHGTLHGTWWITSNMGYMERCAEHRGSAGTWVAWNVEPCEKLHSQHRADGFCIT